MKKRLCFVLAAVFVFMLANTAVYADNDIKKISCGEDFVLILKTNGDLYSFGKNDRGQLGTGDEVDYDTPVKIMSNINDISCGYKHSLVLNKDKKLYGFGDNSLYQLGIANSDSQRKPVEIMTDVEECRAAGFHSFALKKNGNLYGFGNNLFSQLAFSARTEYKKPLLIMQNVSKIESGFITSVIKKSDGSFFVFGKESTKKFIDNKPIRLEKDILDATINQNDDLYFIDKSKSLYKMSKNNKADTLSFHKKDLLAKNISLGESSIYQELNLNLKNELSTKSIYQALASSLNKDYTWLRYKELIDFDKPDHKKSAEREKIFDFLKKEMKSHRYKKEDKLIAITFDDGPSTYTDSLLNDLNRYKARASFFVLGKNAKAYPDALKKIVCSGHEIANHSFSHPNLARYSNNNVLSQIDTTDNIVHQYTGENISLFRPPYGSYNKNTLSLLKNRKKAVIMWSVDTLDWKHKNATYVKNYILNHAKDGDIVLLHDIHKTTVDGFKQALPILIDRGFKLVTVSELMDLRSINKEYGNVYFKLK